MNDRTRGWLELTRISNLPTVLSSAMVGTVFLGGWSFLTGLSFAHFILPTVAICLFYIAGFIFNDLFDRRIDAVERPDRPIPSGRVDPRAAMQVGAFLMIAGILTIFMLERHGVPEADRGFPVGTIAAALLVLLILAYDRFHTRSSWWVFGMGGCRAMVYLVCILTVQGLVFTPQTFGVTPMNVLSIYLAWPEIILISPFPFILTMLIYVSAFSRIARGEVAPDGEGSHYCDACGYLVIDTTRSACSECGHELDPETLERTTTPPMKRWLRTLCLAGILLPSLYLFLLSAYRFSMSLYFVLVSGQNSPNEIWILMCVEMALGLTVLGWQIFAMSRYLRDPHQLKRPIQMWIAGIPLIEALFIFSFTSSVTITVFCLICFFVTIWGHRRVSGT